MIWIFAFLWWNIYLKPYFSEVFLLFLGGLDGLLPKKTQKFAIAPWWSPNHDRWWAVYIAASEKEVRGQPNEKHKTRQVRACGIKQVNKPNIAMKIGPMDKDEDGIMSLPYGTWRIFQCSPLSFERRLDVIQFCLALLLSLVRSCDFVELCKAWQTQCLEHLRYTTKISFEGIMKMFKSLWVPPSSFPRYTNLPKWKLFGSLESLKLAT